MKTEEIMKIIIRTLTLVSLFAARAYAAPALTVTEVNCAAEEMQLFYYYLNAVADDSLKEFKSQCAGSPAIIKMPDWLQKAKPAMLERKVWKDPEEGELSEAAVWQATVSILYELASEMKKTLPAAGRTAVSPFDLEADYGGIRLRFVMSVDRLTRAKLEDSFEGRGGAMLATMNLVMERLDGMMDAMAARDNAAFNKKAGEALKLGRGLFAQLFEAPRRGDGYNSAPE